MRHLLAAGFLLLAVQAAAAEPAGFRSVTIPAEHHGRTMSGALWYPSAGGGEAISYGENAVFFGTPVLDGARMAEGPFPVILASHGLGGNIGALGWLTAVWPRRAHSSWRSTTQTARRATSTCRRG